MKILLLGHKGYLGSYLHGGLAEHEVYTDTNSNSYDCVVNCIGKPDLEFCQEHPEISEESNLNIVKEALASYPSAKVIHFSSYYVYDDEGLCGEGAKTTDRYFYTRHKLESEKLVTDNGGLCFRLGKLFGHMDVEKQNKLTEHIIKSDSVTLDKVQFNPTSLKQLLDVILFELENKCLCGLYNLSNKGNTSHFEYGEFINERLGGRLRIEQIEKYERGFHNYGRFLMDTAKIEDVVPLRGWQEDLEEYLSEGGF